MRHPLTIQAEPFQAAFTALAIGLLAGTVIGAIKGKKDQAAQDAAAQTPATSSDGTDRLHSATPPTDAANTTLGAPPPPPDTSAADAAAVPAAQTAANRAAKRAASGDTILTGGSGQQPGTSGLQVAAPKSLLAY